ncbi:MAG: formate dehydrogenase family accessory protein FdhD [Chloroflexi bacterium]|nr:formate dehydrogenase family accessory protein FdhD [Chloroflexota bacterium]
MYRDAHDPERVHRTRIRGWHGDELVDQEDVLAVEEPLEVKSGGVPLAVIMRTPGHDDELALGFLFTEGLISGLDDVERTGLWQDSDGSFAQNTVTVWLRNALQSPADRQRMFYATSSCGMCGKASIEVAMGLAPPLTERATINPSVLYQLPAKLRESQAVFDRTGGLHAAALFTTEGTLLAAREDVGRHNAVDKLIGRALLDGQLPLSNTILQVSGRVSFEIVQKALVARIPQIVAISAPSSLAVQTARRCNIALVGFLRDGRLNEY